MYTDTNVRITIDIDDADYVSTFAYFSSTSHFACPYNNPQYPRHFTGYFRYGYPHRFWSDTYGVPTPHLPALVFLTTSSQSAGEDISAKTPKLHTVTGFGSSFSFTENGIQRKWGQGRWKPF